MSIENLEIKKSIVDEIKGKLENAQSVVIIDYLGTTVEQASEMRKKLREAGVDYTVYKNTLMTKAMTGTDFEKLIESLKGPSALAISYDDAVAPARVIAKAMKDYEKMQFKAGIVEGAFYDEEGLKKISLISSRDDLIAKFMGSIQNPVSKMVRTLKAIAESKGKTPAPAAE